MRKIQYSQICLPLLSGLVEAVDVCFEAADLDLGFAGVGYCGFGEESWFHVVLYLADELFSDLFGLSFRRMTKWSIDE